MRRHGQSRTPSSDDGGSNGIHATFTQSTAGRLNHDTIFHFHFFIQMTIIRTTTAKSTSVGIRTTTIPPTDTTPWMETMRVADREANPKTETMALMCWATKATTASTTASCRTDITITAADRVIRRPTAPTTAASGRRRRGPFFHAVR